MRRLRAASIVAHVCFIGAVVASMAARGDRAADTAPPYVLTGNPPRADLRYAAAVSRETVALVTCCVALLVAVVPVVRVSCARGATVATPGTGAAAATASGAASGAAAAAAASKHVRAVRAPLAAVAWPADHALRWLQGTVVLMSADRRVPVAIAMFALYVPQLLGFTKQIAAAAAAHPDHHDAAHATRRGSSGGSIPTAPTTTTVVVVAAATTAATTTAAAPRGAPPKARARQRRRPSLFAPFVGAALVVAFLGVALRLRTTGSLSAAAPSTDAEAALFGVTTTAYVAHAAVTLAVWTACAHRCALRLADAATVLDIVLQACITLYATAYPTPA